MGQDDVDFENPYQSPLCDIEPMPSETRVMTVPAILFSFQGRIPRRVYWAATIANTLACYGAIFSAGYFFPETDVEGFVILAVYIPMMWISLAVQAKRWHDRDKSGWWVLIQFVPLIGPLWAFIETGCLRGTIGPNRYGPDPT